MKWIKYQILQSVIDEQPILVNKKVGYNDANLAIAQTEAYNGEYTIEEDGEDFEKEPLAIELGGTGAKTVEDACKNIGGINTYVHSADGLTGVGVNGKFKATFSETISSINIGAKTYNVKQGEETSIDLVEGCWYTFILDGNTINFNSGGVGGGLNFKVVGNQEPASPKENTIWVKTEQDITVWTIRTHEPEQPIEGMVWFESVDANTRGITFNVMKSNELYVELISAYQYQSGQWTPVDSAIYQNGKWIVLGKFIMWDGEKLADRIEFGQRYNATKGTFTINEEEGCLYLFVPNQSGGQNTIYVTEAIDVTRYNKITCSTYIRGWNGGYFGLTNDPTKLTYAGSTGSVNAGVSGLTAQCRPTTVSNTEYTGTNTLDISSITGLQYFVFGVAGAGADNYTGEIKMYSVEFSV